MAAESLCSVENCGKPVFQRGWCSMHLSRWKRHGTLEKTGTANGEPLAHFEKMVKLDTDDCVIWPYSKNDVGYGKIGNRLVHRMACIEENGQPPSDRHEAAHKPGCHNPSCFNRRHVYWATPSENQRDRVADGTSNRGGKFRNSKLKPEDVIAIRCAVQRDGRLHHDVATEFSISRTVVTRIMNGTRWGWLE
jgi:hypothetical protein